MKQELIRLLMLKLQFLLLKDGFLQKDFLVNLQVDVLTVASQCLQLVLLIYLLILNQLQLLLVQQLTLNIVDNLLSLYLLHLINQELLLLVHFVPFHFLIFVLRIL